MVTEQEDAFAEIRILTPVSLVIPTYRERENLPHLAERLEAFRKAQNLELEVLLMDDNSNDGSAEWVAEYGADWLKLITRTGPRGLSAAVVDGLRLARHPVAIVMDADLSHPPERIPQMMLALQSGQDFVIGSRYVRGGSTDDDWGLFRWLNSRVATVLAWTLTRASDPMSGFFAIRRSDFQNATNLNPIGYKIGLELIVKCGLGNIGEIPIHFTDRRFGQSKLTLSEQLKYLLHLRRLYFFKYVGLTTFVMFGLVGLSGLAVNLAGVTLATKLGLQKFAALAVGVVASVISNFLLNRNITFSSARKVGSGRQFASFVAVCAVSATVQLSVSTWLVTTYPSWAPQLAAVIGVAAAFLVNFLGSRFMVFKMEHPPKQR